MSSLQFSANINWMFNEIPALEDRIAAAKKAGFDAVEMTAPFSVAPEILQKEMTKHDMKCTLLNAYSGDASKGDRGIAARPERVEEFKEKLELSLKYAKMLQCPVLHIMAGVTKDDDDFAVVENTYLSNMQYAADRLQQEGVTLMIEFVNSKYHAPNYLVDTPQKAMNYVKKINHPNCKFQMDVFHLQLICGDLTALLKEYMPYTGYIQISQAPNRGEPSSPGEINYDYILPLIQELGYKGYIGCEYKPTGDTVDGLKWMQKWKN